MDMSDEETQGGTISGCGSEFGTEETKPSSRKGTFVQVGVVGAEMNLPNAECVVVMLGSANAEQTPPPPKHFEFQPSIVCLHCGTV